MGWTAPHHGVQHLSDVDPSRGQVTVIAHANFAVANFLPRGRTFTEGFDKVLPGPKSAREWSEHKARELGWLRASADPTRRHRGSSGGRSRRSRGFAAYRHEVLLHLQRLRVPFSAISTREGSLIVHRDFRQGRSPAQAAYAIERAWLEEMR